ncbi:MAG: helix-turn-helix transcriptional regulator [Tepidisphaeraceae bacterium]|jgi:ribosome-binding protein aMBF1 (putative translation factor)
MAIGQLMIDGRRYMVVEESEYSRLLIASSGAAAVREKDLPPLPKPDADGNVPALEYARASLARKLIVQRTARGWSQAELARRAGVRMETINRLEKAKHTADPATARKIELALDMQRHRSRSTRKAG